MYYLSIMIQQQNNTIMKKYAAKTTREAKIWGGGTKTKVEFYGVQANDEKEARADFESMLGENESIVYVCEEKDVPAEDVDAFNNR